MNAHPCMRSIATLCLAITSIAGCAVEVEDAEPVETTGEQIEYGLPVQADEVAIPQALPTYALEGQEESEEEDPVKDEEVAGPWPDPWQHPHIADPVISPIEK